MNNSHDEAGGSALCSVDGFAATTNSSLPVLTEPTLVQLTKIIRYEEILLPGDGTGTLRRMSHNHH